MRDVPIVTEKSTAVYELGCMKWKSDAVAILRLYDP